MGSPASDTRMVSPMPFDKRVPNPMADLILPVKFVPASGAATRMFKDLYRYLDEIVATDYMKNFFKLIDSFPFYRELEKIIGPDKIDNVSLEGRVKIVKTLYYHH